MIACCIIYVGQQLYSTCNSTIFLYINGTINSEHFKIKEFMFSLYMNRILKHGNGEIMFH
jgi:hypothetical protein